MNRPAGRPHLPFYRNVQFWIDNAHALLVLSTYLLLLFSRVIDTALIDRDSQYLSIVLLQVIIFMLPGILPLLRQNLIQQEYHQFFSLYQALNLQ